MPIVNISLDIFAIIILSIILLSISAESIKKESRSILFPVLIFLVILTLAADIVSWIGEGKYHLSLLTLSGEIIAACCACLVIVVFMFYVKDNVCYSSKIASMIVYFNTAVCGLSIAIFIMNFFHDYVYYVDKSGHLINKENFVTLAVCLIIPALCFISMVMMLFISDHSTNIYRFTYVLYALLPAAGAIADYFIHGCSVTYIAFAVCVVILYTNIYIEKRRIISDQKTTLMLSQINPHFMYNTLTAIASMCDIDPKRAKELTIDFSSYLRQNIHTLSASKMIPFSQELKHIETYLKIEKARFGEKVNIIYSIQCEKFALPPLSIQPLVENAIKHGITKKENGGTIKIVTYTDEKNYLIEIIDDGVGFDVDQKIDKQKHIGIVNVRDRLMHNCRATLDIKSKINVGTRVSIKIPKRKAKLNEYISN